jgi:circadian clock protein KaiC
VRSLNVIAGEPGAGKTIFALQMLFHQARQGRKCLYLTTLSEPSLKLITYMQQFSFFDESLIAKHRVVLGDIGSIVRSKGLEQTLTEITTRVEREQPAMVVIDSFKAIRDVPGGSTAMRTFVYDLTVHMSTWGAVSLLVGEYTGEEIASLSEFAIADGIIRLTNQRNELRAIREVEVCKLRGANYVTGGHFFEIGRDGLAFFPRVRSPDGVIDEPQMPDERVRTGAAGLDEMLGGGLPRASTTVVQGGTGTGKTLLGLQFLLEGARSGEPGIHFALEETANQLRQIMLTPMLACVASSS